MPQQKMPVKIALKHSLERVALRLTMFPAETFPINSSLIGLSVFKLTHPLKIPKLCMYSVLVKYDDRQDLKSPTPKSIQSKGGITPRIIRLLNLVPITDQASGSNLI